MNQSWSMREDPQNYCDEGHYGCDGSCVEREAEEEGCPECERSYGPHYQGPCEHES